MSTILRTWAYQYQWFYDGVSRIAALSVGGEGRLRRLVLQGLALSANSKVLDLCCGSGQVTRILVQNFKSVVGLDASPLSLKRSRRNVPEADYIQAFAEEIPLSDNDFDLVHTSMALHEMQPDQLKQILAEVHRILKPGGVFVLIDFHQPQNPLLWPGVALFFTLFETETAWQLLNQDLSALLQSAGFQILSTHFHAGGSLQVIHAQK
jgi:demethylmenaquinone methyltransferase/2-methoxy-6-polyprenyl-1,4-benzoquinol methylase